MSTFCFDRFWRPRSNAERRLHDFVGAQPPLLRAEGLLRAELARQLTRVGIDPELAPRLAYAVQVELQSLPSATVRRQLAAAAAAQLACRRHRAPTQQQWLAHAAAVRLRFPAGFSGASC